ncbi:aldehyde dehydrogenase family protein [Ponticaulis sp.]|uniref:aldehyde dehydrogenase family protein n=1 Tax=Ponticaulis sp. TaxID=2020902 RepID=UPI000B6E2374|nr:aldehyde dehydrogenase family protein [Ponticaulis sp.]MAI90979.1 aldehyde dehydrogenase family protein [Ponticaulis sp.]OUX98320.1 MAG: aldehyde dehydrogenase family protein [Hyphomonadaceae bacterium TMED5]|tara:strand:- start:159010 stop:160431 length:1422 start_codon:yes stop_codon:yes gene_type:complete
MQEYLKFYINGEWVDPVEPRTIDVENPATEEPFARISLGSAADVDKAVAAAKAAFETFSQTSVEYRADLLEKIAAIYQERMAEIGQAIENEMGAPTWLAQAVQAPTGLGHYMTAAKVLRGYEFEEMKGTTMVRKEPIGVCGFITPWNWPANQIACKVAPAIATGCTMVLKPSEIAPIDAMILAEVMHDAGVPAGVFNLVNGDGPGVGQAMSGHKDIDMMSFTGSTRAGVLVSQAAAPTVKRVALELGGKSPNIILPDADLEAAVKGGVIGMMNNTGQSCNAPSRMLVHKDQHDQAAGIAKAVAEAIQVGTGEKRSLGPISNANQYNKVQELIQKGIDEGATLVAGGLGRPDGLNQGYYAKPTVFSNVSNDMTIAQEEIFGPVLCMIPYEDEDDAIRIANDTVYGLSSYVSAGTVGKAADVAKKIRAGMAHLNGAGPDLMAPFGGYKQSGNGREWGPVAFEEFLELKAMMGAGA